MSRIHPRRRSSVLVLGPEAGKYLENISETTSLLNNKRDPEPLGKGKRVLATIVLFGLISSLGIEFGIFGPTLYDMQKRTGSSIQSISFLFTLVSVSSMISSFIFGPMFDKVDGFFLMGVTTIISSISLGFAAWFDRLGPFLSILLPVGINAGTVPMGSVVIAGGLWEKYSSSMYQAVTLMYSISIASGPLVAKPFLLKGPIHFQNTSNSNSPVDNVSISSNGTEKEESKVQYAYMITAFHMGVWSLLSLLIFCCFYGKIRKPTVKNVYEDDSDTEPNTKKFNIIAYICIFIFNVFAGGFDFSSDGYLLTFAVSHLHWTKDNGVYVTLVGSVSSMVATFIGIFIVRYIRLEIILFFDLLLCFGSSLALCLLINSFPSSLWVCTAIRGLGFGTIVPCCLAWAESENMKGGLFNALYWTGLSTGGVAIPPLIGYLFEDISPMLYLYSLLGCIVGMFIVYCILIFVVKCKRMGIL